MDCLTLLIEDQLTAAELYGAILRKLYALWSPAYHRYYRRGPDSGEPFLAYRDWWALVDELRERLQLNQILGLAPDSKVMELRRKLLLANDELPERQGDPAEPETQAREGKIEAYMAVLHAIFYDRLQGEALSSYLSEHIFAVAACHDWLQ
jgi:hypothetical protein